MDWTLPLMLKHVTKVMSVSRPVEKISEDMPFLTVQLPHLSMYLPVRVFSY